MLEEGSDQQNRWQSASKDEDHVEWVNRQKKKIAWVLRWTRWERRNWMVLPLLRLPFVSIVLVYTFEWLFTYGDSLAYIFAKYPYTFPIIGGTKTSQIEDNIKAIQIKLTGEQIKKIENSAPFDLGFPMNMIQPEPQLTGETQNTRLLGCEFNLDASKSVCLPWLTRSSPFLQLRARLTGSGPREGPTITECCYSWKQLCFFVFKQWYNDNFPWSDLSTNQHYGTVTRLLNSI